MNQSLESFSKWFREIPIKKKRWMIVLFVYSVIAMAILPYWGLSIPGIIGIYNWTPPFRYVMQFFMFAGVALPVVLILDVIKSYKTQNPIRVPSRFYWAISLIFVLIPTGLFGFVMFFQYVTFGDKPPQLVLEPNSTKQIPNYAVVFYTQRATQNTLHWGPTPDMEFRYEEPSPSRQHALKMVDLAPATTYYYQINGIGKVYNFTTPPNQSNRLKFAAFGDVHIDAVTATYSATEQIFQSITTPAYGYNLILTAGDYVELGFMDSSWKMWMELSTKYSTHVPILGTVGNHDNFGGGQQWFQAYFQPNILDLNGGTSFWNLHKINGINIITLNLEWSNESFSIAQRDWLLKTLQTINVNEWTVVLCHAFFYSSGTMAAGIQWGDDQNMIGNFHDLFKQHGVDLVISGHNHHLELCEKDGIVYLTVGGGGGHPDSMRTYTSVATVWYQQGKHGFAGVDINGNTMDIGFYTPQHQLMYNYTISR